MIVEMEGPNVTRMSLKSASSSRRLLSSLADVAVVDGKYVSPNGHTFYYLQDGLPVSDNVFVRVQESYASLASTNPPPQDPPGPAPSQQEAVSGERAFDSSRGTVRCRHTSLGKCGSGMLKDCDFRPSLSPPLSPVIYFLFLRGSSSKYWAIKWLLFFTISVKSAFYCLRHLFPF